MKTFLLVTIVITFTTSILASTTKLEDERLCKVFQEKAVAYKETMRSDVYAMKTLASYEKRAQSYCSK